MTALSRSALRVEPAARARVPEHSGAALTVARQGTPAGVDAELWAGLHLPKLTHARQLKQLAQLAQGFTPRVSLEPPDGLLLEVRGSLHLFSGVAGLRVALVQACGSLALQPLLAFAPTPLAALVAARAGKEIEVLTRAQLIGALAPLPLSALRWPPQVVERLKRAGVRTIGAVLRLPRAGFARRFGAAELATLDKLTGTTRELRAAFKPRERFHRRRELNCEAESHAPILTEFAGLLGELEDFLKVRQLGVMALECRLLHRQAAATCCVLNLAAPAADARHIAGLLAEKLSRIELPQPVRALELRPATLLPLTQAVRSLWQPGEHGGSTGNEAHTLIERLRARLGEGAIHGLTLLDDHRPENSWARSAPPLARAGTREPARARAAGRRPLWLLLVPQPLEVRAGFPRRRGVLELLSEPERIESGWWDGADIVRDYYLARDRYGVRLWVFRERSAPHGWFLHGIFG
jgi:protein ImuB